MKSSNKNIFATNLILLGKIGKPHGIRGQVKVQLVNRDSNILLKYRGEIFLFSPNLNDLPLTVQLLDAKPLAKPGRWLVSLENVNHIETAQKIINWTLKISRENYPPLLPDEFWHEDLLGLSVRSESGKPLGIVDTTYPSGGGEIVELRNNNQKPRWFFLTKNNIIDLRPDSGVFIIRESSLLEISE